MIRWAGLGNPVRTEALVGRGGGLSRTRNWGWAWKSRAEGRKLTKLRAPENLAYLWTWEVRAELEVPSERRCGTRDPVRIGDPRGRVGDQVDKLEI